MPLNYSVQAPLQKLNTLARELLTVNAFSNQLSVYYSLILGCDEGHYILSWVKYAGRLQLKIKLNKINNLPFDHFVILLNYYNVW